MVAGSPAWKPQATLALVTVAITAASSPSSQRPKPSPTSELRSTTGAVPSSWGCCWVPASSWVLVLVALLVLVLCCCVGGVRVDEGRLPPHRALVTCLIVSVPASAALD